MNTLKGREGLNAYFCHEKSLPVESPVCLGKGSRKWPHLLLMQTCSGWSKLTEELQNDLANKIHFI